MENVEFIQNNKRQRFNNRVSYTWKQSSEIEAFKMYKYHKQDPQSGRQKGGKGGRFSIKRPHGMEWVCDAEASTYIL